MANPKPSNSWKKGQSGNPKGRPRESWAEALRIVGKTVDKRSGKEYKLKVAETIWEQAIQGNLSAIKILMDRMDGTPKQSTDISLDQKSLPAPIYAGLSAITIEKS